MKEINYIEIAKSYSKKGYSVIPVSPVTKQPVIGGWREFQDKPMSMEQCENFFKNAEGIAVLCGGLNNVFCLDVDKKYFLSHDTWDEYKKKLGKDLLNLSLCQKTKNGGYHLVYSIPRECLKGNEKWANRHATAYEKHKVYMEAYENPKTRDKALKIASREQRVMMETRAKGGYFLIAPTKGYEIIHGKKINNITKQQFDYLEEVTRSFDEVKATSNFSKDEKYYTEWTLSPFDHFNQEGDVVELLLNHGWTIKDERRNSVRFLRPGTTFSNSSALFDTESRLFNCFSTSSSFEVGKTYTAVQLLSALEFEDDWSETYKHLIENNYGRK